MDKKTAALMALSVLGFGLLQGARLIDSNSGPYSGQEFAVFGLFVDGATFLVVAVLSYFQIIERPEPLFAVGTASLAVYLLLGAIGGSDTLVLLAAQTAAGMGWSLTILCWMAVFVAYRPRYSLPMIAAAYLVDVTVHFAASELHMLSSGVLAVVLAASLALLFACIRTRAEVAQRMWEAIVPKTTLEEAFSRTRRAAAGAFAFSLVCGFVIESDRVLTGLDYAQTSLTSAICIGAAAFMIAYLVVFKVRKADMDYISPIAALCISSVLLLRAFGVGGDNAAGSMMTGTLITFYVFLWLMLISEAYERTLPGFLLLGLTLGVARISVGLGRLLARWLDTAFPLDTGTTLACALALLGISTSLIFLSYLRSAAKRARETTEPRIDEEPRDEEDSRASDAADAAFDLLVSTYELSEREAEIIREYASGRSARYIADWHLLSEYTVKTHLRRAYAKMDIHSRQELLDMLEEMESRVLRG